MRKIETRREIYFIDDETIASIEYYPHNIVIVKDYNDDYKRFNLNDPKDAESFEEFKKGLE